MSSTTTPTTWTWAAGPCNCGLPAGRTPRATRWSRSPDAGALFTGDLAETGQFAIFPWFPPYDTDVSGIHWIALMKRLAAASPQVVVPGHGDVGGAQRLADVRDYLELLRDETWVRRDSAMSEATIIDEVPAVGARPRRVPTARQDGPASLALGPAAQGLSTETVLPPMFAT